MELLGYVNDMNKYTLQSLIGARIAVKITSLTDISIIYQYVIHLFNNNIKFMDLCSRYVDLKKFYPNPSVSFCMRIYRYYDGSLKIGMERESFYVEDGYEIITMNQIDYGIKT